MSTPRPQDEKVALLSFAAVAYIGAASSEKFPLPTSPVQLRDCHSVVSTTDIVDASRAPSPTASDLLLADAACWTSSDSGKAIGTSQISSSAHEGSGVLVKYDKALHEHALPTKALTTSAVFGLASVSSQLLSRRLPSDRLDLAAVGQMAAFGALLDTPLQHTWHNALEAFLPGRSPNMVGEKILLDQVLMAPLQLCVFLTAIAILSGKPAAAGVAKIRHELFSVFRVHTAFWTVAHCITFALVPLEYRVGWCTCANLVYVTILALLTQQEEGRSRK
eukprot:CAMPEP_0182825926 /NCGR_PEP_ID=MMETSP0006_2-20121128/16100_1 /TAXON_ID=97485 /ORGANISM="Prymnesium parvum, Strain Texoma1" /LENGTH=276 /DNA_ID=CAMNT_0024953055 /DNA_START=107 /DNA_END=937 /DNA_ORIENTATION=-